jgi:hypothetical protein
VKEIDELASKSGLVSESGEGFGADRGIHHPTGLASERALWSFQ